MLQGPASVDEWINNRRYIHTMEYQSAFLKRNKFRILVKLWAKNACRHLPHRDFPTGTRTRIYYSRRVHSTPRPMQQARGLRECRRPRVQTWGAAFIGVSRALQVHSWLVNLSRNQKPAAQRQVPEAISYPGCPGFSQRGPAWV